MNSDIPPKTSQQKAQIYQTHGMTYALTIDRPSHLESDTKIIRPIILIHGIPGADRDFKYLAPLIARDLPCIRVTLPGFGVLLNQGPNLSRLQDRADYLKKIAVYEGWEEYLVLGHSLGGATALVWAHCDSRVKGIILVNSVGLSQHRGMKYSQTQTQLALYVSYLPYIGDRLLKTTRHVLLKSGFKGEPFNHQQIRLIFQYIIHIDFKLLKKCCDEISQVSICAWTLDDPLIEDEISQHLSQCLPHNQRIIYETGGHNAQKYQASDLSEKIIAFYRQIISLAI